jgi:hypothetical protein
VAQSRDVEVSVSKWALLLQVRADEADQSLLDMPYAHRDVKPVQDMLHPITRYRTDALDKRGITVTQHGDVATRQAANAIWLNAPRGKVCIERFIQLASELRIYLTLNATALVDYGRRYRAGLGIASSGAESVVNSPVNARMNKRRQMRWSPEGAHRVLQVRAADMDGRLHTGQMRIAA